MTSESDAGLPFFVTDFENNSALQQHRSGSSCDDGSTLPVHVATSLIDWMAAPFDLASLNLAIRGLNHLAEFRAFYGLCSGPPGGGRRVEGARAVESFRGKLLAVGAFALELGGPSTHSRRGLAKAFADGKS